MLIRVYDMIKRSLFKIAKTKKPNLFLNENVVNKIRLLIRHSSRRLAWCDGELAVCTTVSWVGGALFYHQPLTFILKFSDPLNKFL